MVGREEDKNSTTHIPSSSSSTSAMVATERDPLLQHNSRTRTNFGATDEVKSSANSVDGQAIHAGDNDGEFISRKFLKFCKECGIKKYFSVRKILQQNGMAERMNKTLMKKARYMRLQVGLPKVFWMDAVDVAFYLVNQSPHTKLDGRIPEEL